MKDASELFEPENLSDQEQSRLQKLEALRARGIDPYPARVKRSHTIAAARALYDESAAEQPAVRVAGRLKRIRVMGKVSFADLDDGSAQIQLFIQRDRLPDGWYNEVWKRLIDLGDFISASGHLSVTRSGELSVTVEEITFLAKTLKPMPDKWHGVRDPEVRYRRRYVDLLANEDVRALFRDRAAVVRALRTYLDDAGFLEVETPILQPLYGGAAAQPFVTHHNQLHQDLYLRISFELYLKRLIVGGFPAVYEIGRDFRNEGVSFKHNPEFTQLEFYEAYADYEDVMRRTEEMVAATAEQVTGSPLVTWQEHTIDFTPPWPRVPLRQAILDASGIDYEQFADEDSLRAQMRSRGIDAAGGANWGKLVDQLLSRFCEHKLIQPTFLVDYPRDLSPLAKGMPDDERLVERFEGFAAGMELCNAFTELNDPVDQLQRFLDENYRAAQGDEEAHPVDIDYVEALSFGMPPTGGFGMGIDRLTMLLTNRDTIREVILFPHLREIDNAAANLNRGLEKIKLGKYEEAIADYDMALRMQPGYAEAYVARGDAKATLGQHQESITDFDQAIQLQPDNVTAYLKRGTSKSHLGLHKEAIWDYNESIRIDPNSAGAYNNRGMAMDAIGNHTDAIADYDIAIQINPEYDIAYTNRGDAKAALARYDDAIIDYDNAIRINPKNTKSYTNRGNVKIALGLYEAAITDFSKAIRINPTYVLPYHNRGNAKIALELHEEAIADYGMAIRFDPGLMLAHYQRGIANVAIDRHQEAIADFDSAIRLDQNYAEAHVRRGFAKSALGLYDEAIVDFDATIRINPKHTHAYQGRGLSHATLAQYEEAVADFDTLIRIEPDNAPAFYNRGLVKIDLQEHTEAIDNFKQTLALAQQQGLQDYCKLAKQMLERYGLA